MNKFMPTWRAVLQFLNKWLGIVLEAHQLSSVVSKKETKQKIQKKKKQKTYIKYTLLSQRQMQNKTKP